MIEYKTYNRSELEHYILSKEFENLELYPISLQRALSHIHNPRAKAEDILLIIAFDKETIAGYIGIMPDELYVNDKLFLCGWLSTLYVDLKYRGKKIAQNLLELACKSYDENILITEFTVEAGQMYYKNDRFLFANLIKGKNYYFLMNLHLVLPSKNAKYAKYSLLLKTADSIGNTILKMLYLPLNSKIKAANISTKMDEEIKQFISNQKTQPSFNRGLPEFSWINNFPWILAEEKVDFNYQFSDFDRTFKNIFLKVYEGENLTSVIMMSERKKTIKIHRVFGDEYQSCADLLYKYVLKNGIYNVICFDEKINKILDKKLAIYKKDRTRKFLIHNQFKKKLPNDFQFKVASADADAVFT